ncbi:helix-hairpin-helix domain-containing protein [Sphaerimonospora mesophila]|uniref:helix-hairpin-helix domain-containing protein n=1 Tax=Sphaerimonospora mesophila TaxID=37483 RepID=UPI0006E12027
MRSRERRDRRAVESRAAETRLRCLIHRVAAEPPAARIRSSPMKPVATLTPPPSFGSPGPVERADPYGEPEPFGGSEAWREPEPGPFREFGSGEPRRLGGSESPVTEELIDTPSSRRNRIVEILRSRSGRFGDEVPMLDPGGPGLRILVLFGVLAAAIAGFVVWRTRPVAEPVTAPVPMSAAMASAGPESAASGGVRSDSVRSGSVRTAASPTPTASVIVYVTGKVRRPGVLALPTGSRVVDAVEAAGGVKKGADPGGVNLARRLVDGEHIIVGADAPAGGGAQPSSQPDGGGVVNLNTATVEQLNTLPGVGEVLARRIIDFRDAHGGFGSVEQLRQVSGIGEKKFAELRDKVTV